MIANIITFILQCLTYMVIQLDDIYLAQNVSLLSVIMIFMVISVCIWIAGGLLRHNGNSG